MKINWDALLAVFTVSLGATVGVVALISVALVGLSARTPHVVPAGGHRQATLSPRTGTALAAVCLTAAAAIVLLGLWTLVAA